MSQAEARRIVAKATGRTFSAVKQDHNRSLKPKPVRKPRKDAGRAAHTLGAGRVAGHPK
jgi:hypothetical protein